jgi:hypothetical protein
MVFFNYPIRQGGRNDDNQTAPPTIGLYIAGFPAQVQEDLQKDKAKVKKK